MFKKSLPTLKAYLFVFFAVTATMPVLFYAYLEIRQRERVQKKEVDFKTSSLAISLAQIQIEKVESRIRAVETVASMVGSIGLDHRVQIQKLLKLYRPQFKMHVLYVGDLSGTSLAMDSIQSKSKRPGVGIDFSDRDYFKAVISDKRTVVSQVQVGRVTGEPSIQIATPVFDSMKRMVGYVSGSLELNEVYNVLEQVVPANSNIRVVVFDRNGKVISQANGNPIQVLTPLGQFAFFKAPEVDMEYRQGIDETGTLIYGLLKRVDRGRLDWTIALSIPRSDLNAQSKKARNAVLIYIAVMLALALWVGRSLANLISKRFSNVIQYVQKVGNGEFEARKPELDAFQTKEIHTLLASVQSMAEKLQEHMLKLEKASRMKSQFLANMSHEIRTPLNGVIGMGELLLSTPLTAEQEEYARTAQTSAESLLCLINDILDFSKIEAGKLSFEFRAIELTEPIRHMVKILEPMAAKKKIELKIFLDSNLPEKVISDSERLGQILMNLVSNAIKFTIKGQVTVSVSLVQRKDSSARVRFQVSDTGVGMSADTKAQLFQAFTQADVSTTRKFGGTGLGLSICKQLVQLMNGQIGVESELGTGSKFWFEIEFEVPQALSYRQSQHDSEGLQRQGPQALRSAYILVAEDNNINQKIISAQLRRLGHRYRLVGNGVEAVAALSEENFDLILMDCQMPEMDGYQAAAEIRSREKKGKWVNFIVAMTASAIEGERDKCRAVGMDDYISKPAQLEHLNQILNFWIQKRYPEPASLLKVG